MTALKRIFSIAIAFCIFVICVPTAFAQQPERTVLRVGYFDYTGFVDKDANGDYSGYAVDYLNAISLYTGYTYEYVYSDWDSLLGMLADGEIDLLCSAQYTKSRAELFDYTNDPIGSESALLYVRDDDDRYYYDDFDAFNGMRVGQLENSYQNDIFADYAAQHGFSYTAVDYKETALAFQALNKGDIDAVAMGNLAVQTGFKTVGHFSSEPFYIITTKGNTDIVSQINGAIKEISIYEPYYEAKLYEKYYETAYYNTKPAFTRSEAQYIQNSGVIKVGVMSNRFPLIEQDEETGELYGIEIDAINLISKLSGLTFMYEPMPSGIDPANYLAGSDAKIAAGLMPSELTNYSSRLRLSDEYMTDDVCFVGRKGEVMDARGEFTFVLPVEYLKAKGWLSKQYPNVKFMSCETTEDGMYALLNNKADYMVQDYYIAASCLQSPRWEPLSIISAYNLTQRACLGVHDTESPELMSIINKCISRIDKQDIVDSIASYTTGRPYHMTVSDFLYKYRVAVAVGGTMLAAVLVLLVTIIMMRARNELVLQEKNKQLHSAMLAAENASSAKGAFLSNMSHDIRTPMNVIINMTQLALDDSADEALVREYLGKIKFMGRYLLGLINNILDVSKIESGKMELHFEPYTFKMFLDSIYTMIQPMCDESKINFVTECEENYPPIMVDATRFNQIFYNFLSNAVKYTPAGGTVFFKMKNVIQHDGVMEWDSVIEDTGIGMSEGFQKHMFDPFAQEKTSLHNAFPKMNGTGLGLAIAKSFTELMGGSVKVESKLGEGTKITVHMCCNIADEQYTELQVQENKSFDISQMNILLAEDHPLNAEIACRLLNRKGAKVTWCENGADAAEAFKNSAENEYDAVLMDIRMPVMDGYEATRTIRRLERKDAKTVPIIAMTAGAYETDRKESFEAGMNAHIAKPIVPQHVYETLYGFYRCQDKKQ